MGRRRTTRSKDDSAGRKRPAASDILDIQGDPGVGGLLADPQAPAVPRAQQCLETAPASPDPEPPRMHGDWLPTHKSHGRPAR